MFIGYCTNRKQQIALGNSAFRPIVYIGEPLLLKIGDQIQSKSAWMVFKEMESFILVRECPWIKFASSGTQDTKQ